MVSSYQLPIPKLEDHPLLAVHSYSPYLEAT
jgi:hypothetical protein